jgi:uncharacterized membrane protein
VIGWIFETTVVSIEKRKFSYRGFLLGPYLPIYGSSAMAILLILNALPSDDFLPVFLTSVIVATTLEYAVSVILDKIFKTSWWDYADYRFNYHGRVALLPSLVWGVIGTSMFYYINPPVVEFADFIYSKLSFYPMIAIVIVFLTDITLTIVKLVNLQTFFKKVRQGSGKIVDIVDIDGYIKSLARSFNNGFVPSVKRLINKSPIAAKITNDKKGKN